MMRSLVALLALVTSPGATPLRIPTAAYVLAWDGSTGFDHYEVRFGQTSSWTNVGRAMRVVVPPLTPGTHTVQARGCRTPTSASCVVEDVVVTVGTPGAPEALVFTR